MLIEDVEDIERYRPGGYHPLQIGDKLNNGRYQVVDKLGYGGYSTTWLARDLRNATYVALKVATADSSEGMHDGSLLQSLATSSSRYGLGVLGAGTVPALLDEFWVAGPNGRHRCIATKPAQMSLLDAKEASVFGLFQPGIARSIIAQLICGVAFLHSRDIVHGGMLTVHWGKLLRLT